MARILPCKDWVATFYPKVLKASSSMKITLQMMHPQGADGVEDG